MGAQDGKQTSTESYPSQASNYPWIINTQIERCLEDRVNDRPRYFIRLDGIEIGISFVLGTGQNKPDALKKINKSIEKINKEYREESTGIKEKDLGPLTERRSSDLLDKYDQKFEILLESFNEWVQLFKKPIKRIKSQIWTGP